VVDDAYRFGPQNAVAKRTFAAKGFGATNNEAGMEMIMSTMSHALPRREFVPATASRRVAGIFRRWWIVYMKWRLNDMAISQLRSMSDRELKDMGVYRAGIDFAVRSGDSHPRFRRYY
jgi:uncharacterized protein YjiS (DUF1127 family)